LFKRLDADGDAKVNPAPYTLHPTPYTLRPYALHPNFTSYNPQLKP